MPEPLRRKPARLKPSPRMWEGLPGVTYPEATTPRPSTWGQDTLPDPAKWASSIEAARAFRVSGTSARTILSRAKARSIRARGNVYWERSTVESIAAARTHSDALPPAEWMDEPEARAALGYARSTMDRLAKGGKVRTRKAWRQGKERLYFSRDDIAQLRALLQQKTVILNALQDYT